MEAVELASCIALLFFTQYGFEVDRTNERFAHLASPFHPAILQIIKMTINSAHAKGKWVGLCGEMAGDPLESAVLRGMGLNKFSMTASSISQIKEILRHLDQKYVKKLQKPLRVYTIHWR
ncbi:MAG: hypothetical protein HGB14_01780 [Anaerolineaceae bacterium]|nr:hypothetical protein [Anaerolineaceae bacterium]